MIYIVTNDQKLQFIVILYIKFLFHKFVEGKLLKKLILILRRDEIIRKKTTINVAFKDL